MSVPAPLVPTDTVAIANKVVKEVRHSYLW